jgi:16S rRNA (guanine(966)-N(2))-methyltransferase RsmD
VRAGALKGQRLSTPRGRTTRPTADQVRIACLDTLMPFLDRGPFLDLFAGAGGVGIEALSRGAPSATFVEQDGAALRALRENVERLGLADRARVLRADAARAATDLGAGGERFAVIFLDPPYDSPRAGGGRVRRDPAPGGGGGDPARHQDAAGGGSGRARALEDAPLRGDDLDFLSIRRVD